MAELTKWTPERIAEEIGMLQRAQALRIAEEIGMLQMAQALDYKWAFPVADGLSVLRELQVWQRATELLAEVAKHCCEVGTCDERCPAFGATEEDCGAVSGRLSWAVRTARAELEAKPDGA